MAQLNNSLEIVLQGLRPTTEYQQIAREVAETVCTALKGLKSYSIDRCIMSGSFGRGTAIGDESDFDIVVFINKERPPFHTSLMFSFEQAIQVRFQTTSRWIYKNTRITQTSIQFFLKSSDEIYKFELAPASNFVPRGRLQLLTAYGHNDDVKLQAEAVRQQLKYHRRYLSYYAQYYDSSLAEEFVVFLKKQPTEVLEVVKLAKFWEFMLPIPEERVDQIIVPERSRLIELIAIKSQEGANCYTLLNRFIRFLKMMKNLSNLRIIFHDYFEESTIPREVLAECPLVMNPCNPFHNVAHGIMFTRSEAAQIFVDCAENTLHRIASGSTSWEDILIFYRVD